METQPSTTAVVAELQQAFARDHQEFTRGIVRLEQALQADDLPAAVRAADELDRAAGAHIAFEEAVLYPQVAAVRGDSFAGRLYNEHTVGRDALQTLQELGSRTTLSTAERELLLSQLRTLSEHVLSCGTLVSYLTALDPAAQAGLLASLQQYRRQGGRWTDLPPQPAEAPPSPPPGKR